MPNDNVYVTFYDSNFEKITDNPNVPNGTTLASLAGSVVDTFKDNLAIVRVWKGKVTNVLDLYLITGENLPVVDLDERKK